MERLIYNPTKFDKYTHFPKMLCKIHIGCHESGFYFDHVYSKTLHIKNQLETQDVRKMLMYTPIKLGDTKLIEPKKWINRLLKILS